MVASISKFSQAAENIKQFSSGEEGILYVVATPIGNLGDITFRALEILKSVALIACEDTRMTLKLLGRFGIKNKLVSYNDHSDEQVREKLLNRLAGGKSIALVSDAGTPLISDPGFKLIRQAAAQQVKIVPIPGVSSVITALSIAGLPTDAFYFAGFLPASTQQLKKKLQELRYLKATLVFFESANRLVKSLVNILQEFGDRQCALCREMTKLHEEIIRGPIAEVISTLQAREAIKGEVVIIISGQTEEQSFSLADIANILKDEMASGSVKTAVENTVAQTGHNKKEVYKIALKIKEKL